GISFNDLGGEDAVIIGKERVSGVESGYWSLRVVKGEYGLRELEYIQNIYDGYSNEWIKDFDAMIREYRYTLYDYSDQGYDYAVLRDVYAYVNELTKAFDPFSDENKRDYLDARSESKADIMKANYRVGFLVNGKEFDLVKDISGEYRLEERHAWTTRVENTDDIYASEDELVVIKYSFSDSEMVPHTLLKYYKNKLSTEGVEGLAATHGIEPEDITVTSYSLDYIRGVYSTGGDPAFILGIQYVDDPVTGEAMGLGGVKYEIEDGIGGEVAIRHDITDSNVIVKIEFIGDNNDGQGMIAREWTAAYDDTYDENKFVANLKTRIEEEYLLQGVYTTTKYSLMDLRRAHVIAGDFYADEHFDQNEIDDAIALVAEFSYTNDGTDGEAFKLGDDRYRVFENFCNQGGEALLIMREKYNGTLDEYSMMDYSVSVPTENLFKMSDIIYTAVHTTDPLQGLPDHAGWEKYYYEIHTVSGVYTTTFPNASRGTWQVEIAGKIYDIEIDELNGNLLFREMAETSEPLEIFEFDSVYGGSGDPGDDVENKRLRDLRSDSVLAYEEARANQTEINNAWFWYYTEIQRKYRIRETDGGEIRYGRVITQAGGEYGTPASDGVVPEYVNTVKIRDAEGVYRYYDIFVGENDPERFYMAYNSDPDINQEEAFTYRTVEFAKDMTVFADGARFKGVKHYDEQGELASVSLARMTEAIDAQDGLMLENEFFFAGHIDETYTVDVGSGHRHIERIFFGNSYYPDAYLTEPADNTVLLDDGRVYDVAIDPEDPEMTELVHRNINSYGAPQAILGDEFFRIEDAAEGHYRVWEAFAEQPTILVSYTFTAGTECVEIDGGLFEVSKETLPTTRTVYKLDKMEIIVSEKDTEQMVVGIGDRFYLVQPWSGGRHVFTDLYNEAERYFSVIVSGDERVYFSEGEMYWVTEDSQTGKISLEGNFQEYAFEGVDAVIEGEYFLISTETMTDNKRYMFDNGITQFYSEWAMIDDSNIYRSIINIRGINYNITATADGKIVIAGDKSKSSDVYIVTVNGREYVMDDTARAKDFNAYRLFDGDNWYAVDPPTNTIRLADGVLYTVGRDGDDDIMLTEANIASHDVQTVEMNGKIYLAYKSFNDGKHEYKFYDGFGRYSSAQDTFGFYQDEDNLYNNYAFYRGGNRGNYENYEKTDMFSFLAGEKFRHNEINYRIDAQGAGIFDIGLSARTYKDIAAPSLNGQDIAYKFTVTVDGIEKGSFLIRAKQGEFVRGNLPVYLAEGGHDLNITWSIPDWYDEEDIKGDLSVEIKDIFVADSKLDIYDLDGDLDVDADDLALVQIGLTSEVGQEITERAFELKDKLYYYEYDGTEDTYVIYDGTVTGQYTVVTMVNDVVYIDGVWYNVTEVSEVDRIIELIESGAGATSQADQVIEVDGIEYMIFWQDTIVTFQWGASSMQVDSSEPEIILNGTLYTFMTNQTAKTVILEEVIMEAMPVFHDAVEVANKIYKITILEDGTARFVDARGNMEETQLDSVDVEVEGETQSAMVGSVFLGGIFYGITVYEDGSLELAEMGAPIHSDSSRRITLGTTEYAVLDNGNGTYTFGRLDETVPFISETDGTVEIFDGDHTTTYYIYENPADGTLALFRDPINHSVTVSQEGNISVMLDEYEAFYDITQVVKNQGQPEEYTAYRFTDAITGDFTTDSAQDGTVTLSGITYQIRLEGSQMILEQKPITSDPSTYRLAYMPGLWSYDPTDTDIIEKDFEHEVFDESEWLISGQINNPGDPTVWQVVGKTLYEGSNDNSYATDKKAIYIDSDAELTAGIYKTKSSISADINPYDWYIYAQRYNTTNKVYADLYTGYIDEGNYYRMRFGENDTVTSGRMRGGEWEQLSSINVYTKYGINITRNQWRNYAFSAWADEWGTVLKAYIDGYEVLSVNDYSDQAIAGGKAGVGAAANVRVYFDDLKFNGLRPEKVSVYEVTQTGDGKYVFDDGIFRPLISGEDAQGKDVVETHRAIKLEDTIFMVSHDASTDTYYLEDGRSDALAAKVGQTVDINGITYDVTGTSADNLQLTSVIETIGTNIPERIIQFGEEYFLIDEVLLDRTPIESTEYTTENTVFVPVKEVRDEDDFYEEIGSQWNLTALESYSSWTWENHSMKQLYYHNQYLPAYQDLPAYQSAEVPMDHIATYMFRDEEGVARELRDYTVHAKIQPIDWHVYNNSNGMCKVDIYARLKDKDNYYRVRISEDDTVTFTRRWNAGSVTLATINVNTEFGIDILEDAWREYSFSVWGDDEFGTELRLVIDGQEVLSFLDDDSQYVITEGYAGVGTEGATRAIFDNVRIDYLGLEEGALYTVETTTGGNYMFTSTDGVTYVDGDGDMEVAIGEVVYLIDDLTSPGEVLLTEKYDAIQPEDIGVMVAGTEYQVTETGTPGEYQLDNGVDTPILVQTGSTTNIDGVVYGVSEDVEGNLTLTGDREVLQVGDGDYVNLGSAASLDLGDTFTIGAWVRPDVLKNNGCIAAKTVSARDGSDYSFILSVHNTGALGAYRLLDGAPVPGHWYYSDSASIKAGEWYYVTWVLEDGRIHYYVNGESYGSSPFAYTDDTSHRIYIGSWRDDSTTSDFNGAVDDMSIWNTALTQEDMVELMSSGPADLGDLALAGYYDFNDVDITPLAAADTSSAGNDGLVFGATSDYTTQSHVYSEGWRVKVNGKEYIVGSYTDESGELRATLSDGLIEIQEKENGYIIVDAHTAVKVSGLNETLELMPNIVADLDNDGDIDADDEDIILYSIENAEYDWMADIDGNGVVDGKDLDILRRWMFGTEQVSRINVDGVDYNVTKNGDSVYTFENISTGDKFRSGFAADGTSYVFMQGLRWMIEEGTGGIIDRLVTPKVTEDIRAFTLNDGIRDMVKEVQLGGEFTSSGKVYKFNGTAIEDIEVDLTQKSMKFDGSNDYVTLASDPDLMIEDYTVSIWIKPDGKPNETWKGIIGKAGRNFNIWLHRDGYIYHRFHTTNSWSDGIANTPKGSVKWNQWNHIVITNDGSMAKTYINGVEMASGAVTAPMVADDRALYIARNLDGSSGNYFKGLVDDAAIYDRSVLDEEVETLYIEGPNVNDTSLVLYYTFDDGTATDTVGNNDAVVSGPILNVNRERSVDPATYMVAYDNDLWQVEYRPGATYMTNGTEKIYFDAFNNTTIDNKLYHLENAGQADVRLVGPISESKHIKDLEVTYEIDDSDPNRIVLVGSPTKAVSQDDNTVIIGQNVLATYADHDAEIVDDFNDGNVDGWQFIGGGEWINDSYHLFRNDSGTTPETQAIFLESGMEPSASGDNLNCSISARIYPLAGTNSGVDLYARYQDENNFYRMRLAENDVVYIQRVREGTTVNLASLNINTALGINILEDNWYRFGFAVDGDTGELKAYVNTEEVLSVIDDPEQALTWGKAGVGCPANIRAYFDDVVLGTTRVDNTNYYTVDMAGDEFRFTDDLHPSLVTEDVNGTKLLFTYATIELEGIEYKVVHDVTTNAYDLYDETGVYVGEVAIDSTITIDGTEYTARGTDEYDFRLESIPVVISEDIEGDYGIMDMQDEKFYITESTIQERSAIQPVRSIDDYIIIRGLGEGYTEGLVRVADFNDTDTAMEGFVFTGEPLADWVITDHTLHQSYYYNSTGELDEYRAIYQFSDVDGSILPWREDYSVTVDVYPYDWHKYNNSSGARGGDIYLRYQDQDNFYRMRFEDNDIVEIQRKKDGTLDVLDTVNVNTEFGINIRQDQWREFTFKTWGDTLKAFVGDEEVLSVVDDSELAIESGYVGVGCPPYTRTYFDDIVIKEIIDFSRSYFKIESAGDQYVFTEERTGAVYTSNAEGTAVDIEVSSYSIEIDGDDIVLTETLQDLNPSPARWIELEHGYYRVTEGAGAGEFNLANELGESIDVTDGDMYNPYKVQGTTVDDLDIVGTSLKFDGSNDYINTNTDFSWTNNQDFSIGFFLKPDTVSGIQGILGKGEAGGYGTGNYEYTFRLVNGTLAFMYWDTSAQVEIWLSTSGIEAEEWTHIMVAYDATAKVATLYRDGVAVATDTTIVDTFMDRATPMLIGHSYYSASTNYYFNGILDEVCVFNADLSEADVQNIVNSGLTGSESDLAAYYSFDDGTASDDSVNSNDGTISGAGAYTPFRSDSGDYEITIKGDTYFVSNDFTTTVLVNNLETLEEQNGLIEHGGSGALYGVSGSFDTLELVHIRRADLDGDGDIDGADEAIINSALLQERYDSAADINGDGFVDNADLAIFLSQRPSTSQVAKYAFTGLTDTYDHFVTRTADGRFLFDRADKTGDVFPSDVDGVFVPDIDGSNYYMDITLSDDASDMGAFDIREDNRIFHFYDGTSEVGYAQTLQTIPSSVYEIKGSDIDDMMLEYEREGLYFDGSGDYVRIDDSTDFNFVDALTVSAWVKVDDKSGYREAAAHYGYPWPTNASWIMRTSQNGNGHFTPHIATDKGAWSLDCSALPMNQWVHIAMTYDGQTLKGYINGELDNYRLDVSGNLNDPTTYMTIGSMYADNEFGGNIDEFALFNRTLTEEGIKALMTTTLSGEEADLKAYYSLNGGQAVDGTGNGHNGTLYGNTRLFNEVETSRPEITQAALIYNGDVYELTGSEGAWQLTSGANAIVFDSNVMTVIDGREYRLTGIGTSQIRLEGPIAESVHVKSKEKIYVVTGTDPTDVVLSELTVDSEETGKDVIALRIDGEIRFYNVSEVGDGNLLFTEGIYPPVITGFDGTYTTFKTHRTIELEGIEYKIAYDETTSAYGLYDEAGGVIPGLVPTAEGTYTTEIGGIVYKIIGASADDFKLESVIDTTLTETENVISIDNDQLSISQNDKAQTPRESTDLDQKAVALSGEEYVILNTDNFDDRDIDGWNIKGNGTWYVTNDQLNQGYYNNASTSQPDDMRAIFMYSEEGASALMREGNYMITAQIDPYDWHMYNDSSGASGADLYMRYQDELNWYRFRFDEFDVVKIERMSGGVLETMASVNVDTEYGIDIKEDQWREFSFGAWGNELKAYVGNTEVLSLIDTDAGKRLESGYAGVGCPANARTFYDDITLKRTDLKEKTYYNVAEIGGAFTTYSFTDVSLAAVYTSNAEGTAVTIAGTAYDITRFAGDIVLTQKDNIVSSDLNRDGVIDADDKTILDDSLASGLYDAAADINDDLTVDETDYMLFRAEYATTAETVKHMIPGQILDDDYYITRALDGTLLFDNNDTAAFASTLNGEYVYGIGDLPYRVSGAQGPLEDIALTQDITLYTFNDGYEDIAEVMIGDSITFNGEDYIVGGTSFDDIVLYREGEISWSAHLDIPSFAFNDDFYALMVEDNVYSDVDTFQSNADGWSDTRTYDCNNTTILGGYGQFDYNVEASKTYYGIPRGFIVIEFDYYYIDSWDGGENGYLEVNGQRIWEEKRYDQTIPACGGAWTDHMGHFRVVYQNNSDELTLKFGSTTNQNVWDETWGIDNVRMIAEEGLLYSPLGQYDFGDDNTAMIDDVRYRVNSSDPENIIIEGPISESVHVTEEEKTYIVEGLNSADVIVTELPATGEITAEKVIPVTDEGGATFYELEEISGTFYFDDGIYPPLESFFNGEYTVVNTYRVLDLEGAEYRITYDASTNTYALYDETGSLAAEDLTATATGDYTTLIDGIVYKIFGTSADDFELVSVKGTPVGAVPEEIITLGGEALIVMESILTRPAIISSAYTTKSVIFRHAVDGEGSVFEPQGAYYDTEAGVYYDITMIGNQYILSDGTQEGTYTSDAAGTEVTVGEITYDISVDGDNMIFTEKQKIIDAVADAATVDWIELVGKYYKVTDNQDGSYTLVDGVGGSIDVNSGDYTSIEGMLYDVSGTTIDDFELSADCIDFDGNDDYINTNTDFSWTKEDDFSIGFFMNPATLSGIQGILGKGEAGGYGAGNYEYSFRLSGSTLSFVYWDTGGRGEIGLSTTVEQDEWAHIMVTYDATAKVARLYKNGVVVSTDTDIKDTFIDRATPMLIGHAYNTSSTNYYFNGEMDEVFVFDKNLSEPEVQEIMSGVYSTGDPDLAAYYSFNDGTAADNSANSNDGTINGATAEGITSSHLATDSNITVYGQEFAVEETDEGYKLFSNVVSIAEDENHRIIIDDIRMFKVSEQGGFLHLEQIMIADLNRDGDIDTSDEAMLLEALESEAYDHAADLNNDLVIDGLDQAIFRALRATTDDVGKHIIPGGEGLKDYYITESPDGRYCFESAVTGEILFSNVAGTVIENIENMWYLIEGADVRSLTMTDDRTIYVFNNGSEVIGSTILGRDFRYNGEAYHLEGSTIDDLVLYLGATPSEHSEDTAFIVAGNVYHLSGAAGTWTLTSDSETVVCDANDLGIINGVRYHVNAADPENIVLEWPVSESSHVTGMEKTYVIEGTGIDDLIIYAERTTSESEVDGKHFVFADVAGEVVYYRVYTTTSGDIAFDDGLYPPIVAMFDGQNTTMSTHRVIDLEGVQYRITHDASTDTYALYDELGRSVDEGLIATATGDHTTSVNGIVYKIIGTSADDFKLESARDIIVGGSDTDTMITIDGDIFKVTESELIRSAFTSTALSEWALGYSIGGSVIGDVYYDITTDATKYIFSDGTVEGTYTSNNDGTEVNVEGIIFTIDATTVAGEVILEEKQQVVDPVSADWIELEGTYYRVTQEGTTDTYYLDKDIEGEDIITVQAGYTTVIGSVEYWVVATSADDLHLDNYTLPIYSSKVSDWQVTVLDEDFVVTEVSGDLVLVNNARTITEDASGQVYYDPVRPFDITGSFTTLQLTQEMISDVNGDGDIDSADETIILNAITGTFTSIADINGDLAADEDDLELLYMQWLSTERARKHSIPIDVGQDDFYITMNASGNYRVDSNTRDMILVTDEELPVIYGVRYRVTGIDLDDVLFTEDVKVYTFNDGAQDIAKAMITDTFTYDGETYTITGTEEANIVLVRGAFTSFAVTDPVYVFDGDFYAQTGASGSIELFDGSYTVQFAADDTGVVNNVKYASDFTTNPLLVTFEGPVSESAHVTALEETFLVEGVAVGAAPEDIGISAIFTSTSPADFDEDGKIDSIDETFLLDMMVSPE
ncbi:LamG-like jellyroll fold domain-containing protein, partial [Candidatus Omnitrophota bacterium]